MAYVDLAGVKTYYEVTGSGAPLVLLHGGVFGAESWFAQTQALAAAPFSVYLPERRGHGHTPDVPGPLTYQAMADDTVAFLEAVVREPAHLVGWSDGGVVGALVAAQRPDLVNRLILIGQYFYPSGKAPNDLEGQMFQWRDAPPDFLHENYDRVSPDGPEHFVVFYGKLLDMIAREPDIALAELAAIQAQTLILQGDEDLVRIEHSTEVAAAIPNARLAVLPGTHALPVESPALVNLLLISFLRDGPPAAAWLTAD
jgi:pimeloyl-ACP methyl ester carboxylesterase